MEYQINLAFQKRIAGEADACLPDRQVDALMLVVQEAGDWLHGRRLGEAVCMRTTNEPLIEINHLRELRQFTSVLTAVCRTYR